MSDEAAVAAAAAAAAADQRLRAFEQLVASYQGKVFRLCYSILGNRAAAEDAAQEAFLKAWRALDRFHGGAALSTWLYAIARNTALSHREQAARRAMFSLDAIGEPAAAAAAAAAAAPPGAGDPEQELWNLVAALPEPYRRVIVLFHMEGKSYEEVARMLNLPLNTVRTHLHRARKLLGATMEEEKQ